MPVAPPSGQSSGFSTTINTAIGASGPPGRGNGWVFVVGHGGGQNRPEDDLAAKPRIGFSGSCLVPSIRGGFAAPALRGGEGRGGPAQVGLSASSYFLYIGRNPDADLGFVLPGAGVGDERRSQHRAGCSTRRIWVRGRVNGRRRGRTVRSSSSDESSAPRRPRLPPPGTLDFDAVVASVGRARSTSRASARAEPVGRGARRRRELCIGRGPVVIARRAWPDAPTPSIGCPLRREMRATASSPTRFVLA